MLATSDIDLNKNGTLSSAKTSFYCVKNCRLLTLLFRFFKMT